MADRIVIKKNFKYMLYPNAAQIVAMDGQLAEACRLTPRIVLKDRVAKDRCV